MSGIIFTKETRNKLNKALRNMDTKQATQPQLDERLAHLAIVEDDSKPHVQQWQQIATRLLKQRNALQAQRDELLAACKQGLAFIDDGEGGYKEAKAMRAAIARATEGGKVNES